jgi:DNA-binding CsgD family transcriptional regulator
MKQQPERGLGDSKHAEGLSAPLGHAQGRQMPGAIVMGDGGEVEWSNGRASEMLRDVGSFDERDTGPLVLPQVLESLVPELRARLRGRTDTSAAALLTVDMCVRARNMDGPAGRRLLLMLERVQRRDAVAQNLERFSLSPRESDVVMLVLYGHSNRRIANQLFLTEYTIEDHLKRIFSKLGVRSRTALAAKILGWGEPDSTP